MSKHTYMQPYAHIQAHTYKHTYMHIRTHTCSHMQKSQGRAGLSHPRIGGTASVLIKSYEWANMDAKIINLFDLLSIYAKSQKLATPVFAYI